MTLLMFFSKSIFRITLDTPTTSVEIKNTIKAMSILSIKNMMLISFLEYPMVIRIPISFFLSLMVKTIKLTKITDEKISTTIDT
jgi:hypothetical protein